ncbi:MAG: helix-turn-helix domain-containing protein [Euzebyaceae bacterium]|nr:helix-turn-helix domain-containing protein [Euzebyaceae bacterium]
MATLPPRLVADDDRRVLQGWIRAHTTEQRMVQRARVVLLAADGATNRTIAAATGLSQQAVGPWRARYSADGLDGLRDKPRPGRRPHAQAAGFEPREPNRRMHLRRRAACVRRLPAGAKP